MKKFLLVLSCAFLLPISVFSQVYSNGTGGGYWNDAATWSGGVIPSSSDNVVISSGDVVTIKTTQSCNSITINATDTTNYGTLVIETGATLNTEATINVYGILKITGGTFNEGNSSGDYLYVNGSVIGSSCLFDMSGGTLNTSRYFSLKSSASFNMTGGTMNINSSGGTSATDIFYVPSGTKFTMSNGTINILKGNKGDGAALKFNPTTANVSGGTISFTNTDSYQTTTTMICSKTLYNINCDVSSGDTLVIKNMPSTTGGFSCNDFTITSGTAVIEPGEGMTVNGTLTNNGTSDNLVILSDTSGNGSLITNSSVNATVQRYIAAYSSGTNGWHEISSPVNNMAISGSDFAPGTASPNLDDFYAWDESTNTWLNYKVTGNNITNFTNGYGYLVAYQTTATKNFTGTLNTSDISISGLSYTNGKGHGWHLLGNPYASALKWGDTNWSLNHVNVTAKVWDESSGNYTDVSSGGIIPSTNGFFVEVDSSYTGSLTIPSADRIHSSTNNYKTAEVQEETLQFKVTGDANSYCDVATLGFRPHATNGYDNTFDSHKLFTFVKTAPSLWTVSDKQDFSTNYLPEPTSAKDVPLNFKPGVNGVYHLSWKGIQSFSNQAFVLEDLQTGKKINMHTQKEYDFTADKNDDADRFVLHISSTTGIPHVNKTASIQVYAYGSSIYLHGQSVLSGKVFVFNTLGQKVYEGPLNGANRQQIRLNHLQQGIYFVKVKESRGVVTRKVFLK